MTTNCTATETAFYANTHTMWTEDRDSYGRRTRRFYATHRGQWGTVAVVVTMPKSWVESHGDDRYLVSDHRVEAGPRPEPIYFRSLAKAKAHAESLHRPLTAEEIDGLDAYAVALAGVTDLNVLAVFAEHHADGWRATWDSNRDQADLHEVMRRMVRREIDRRTNRR